MINRMIANLKFMFLFLLSLVVMDRFFFGFVLWKMPNESPWGTNHFFNFVYEYKQIQSNPSKEPVLLVVGSSIGYYSIDRKMMQDYLFQKTGKKYKIEYFSYAGMTPLDAHLTLDAIIQFKPELIVYPINFIDFRLYRAYSLDPSSTNFSMDDNRLVLDALNFVDAPQSKYAFPDSALLEFYNILPIEKSAEYLASILFLFYRYREIYLQNISNYYNHRFGKNISYHGYAGVQITEGINSLGWTGKKFSFQPLDYMSKEGFYIQLVPEIFSKGELEVNITNLSGKSQQLKFHKPEWVRVQLKPEFIQDGSTVTLELSNTWLPYQAKEDRFDHSRDSLGVRLQQTFGLEKPLSNMQYVREYRMEDGRYITMDDSNYREYFYYRLLADLETRPGIVYLHALKDAKERLTKEKFRPTIHYQYLKKFSKETEKLGIPLLIINNPENPLSLEWYENSNWYKEQLEFLLSLETKLTKVKDMHSLLKMQDFSDFHHLTYFGMEKMNPIYGDAILPLLK